MHRIFPVDVVQQITHVIEARVISAGDLMHRKHPIMQNHKVATAAELTDALLGCLLSMNDADKQAMIDVLTNMISKSVD